MKIIKFGTITELPDGRLEFSNFNIDCEGTRLSNYQSLLFAVVQRLMHELEMESKAADKIHNLWFPS